MPPYTIRTVLLALSLAATLAAGTGRLSPASAAAADFSPFRIPVSCTDLPGAPAWAKGVYRDDGTIELRTSVCAAIDRAVARNMRNHTQLRDAAFAVLTLGHELSHALGTHDRNVTATGEQSDEADCEGWRLYPWVAGKLGIRRATIARLELYVRATGDAACARSGG